MSPCLPRIFSLFVLFSAATTAARSAEPNLAAGRPVIASGELWPGYPASNLTDENPATFTHPNTTDDTTGFYFLIDLGESVLLERLVITGRGDGCCTDRLRRYRVELLADNGGEPGDANWTGDIRMDNSVMSRGESDTIRQEDGDGVLAGRYIRITNISGQAYNPQIAEVAAYPAPGPEVRLFLTSAGNITAGGNPGLPSSAVLTWQTSYADSVTLDPPAGDLPGTSGSITVAPDVRTTYTLTAWRGGAKATATVTIGVDEPFEPLRITELSAAGGTGLEDEDGDSPDWIEIHNPNPYTVNPAGAHLTDSAANPRKWTFPDAGIPPGGYLTVFASGKDRAAAGSPLHAGFSLSQDGEFLGLYAPGGEVLWSLVGAIYPPQRTGVSYGLSPDGEWRYYRPASPGEANAGTGYPGFTADPQFSVTRGFYDAPQTVTITCATPGAVIRFTQDGRPPSRTTGTVYSGPLTVDRTTVLRAIAYADDILDSAIETHTYIFLNDVIASSTMRTSVTQHPEYGQQMRDSLRDVPTVSLVTAQASGINGDAEVPAYVEFLDPALTTGGAPGAFQVPRANAGVRHFGGAYTDFAKKNFRLYFRGLYGDTKLNGELFEDRGDGWLPATSFDSLELRGGSHDMVMRGFYLSNFFCDDTLAEMGHVQPHGRPVHLYINGRYHGLYHLRERWGASMVSSYLGGGKEDYEAINGNLNVGGWATGTVYDGDGSAWDRINRMRRDYEGIAKYVDIDQYLDYMIVWMFGNAEDEYRAAGPWREEGGSGFKFMLNDADGWLSINESNQIAAWDGNQNNTQRAGSIPGRAPGDGPASLLSAWLADGGPEFRIRLADRIQRALGPGGALSRARNQARLTAMAAAFERPFLAEAARWNYRTPASWAGARDRCLNNWLPSRTQAVLAQFRSAGLYPTVAAPAAAPESGAVPAGGGVTLTAQGTSLEILYTTDGSDPRLPGGSVNPAAVRVSSGAVVPVTRAIRLRARARNLSGTWSALTEAYFLPEGSSPLPPGSVVVSELHYFPQGNGAGEFIELTNVSPQTVNLRGGRFTSGIRFGFSQWVDTLLEPGARLILVDSDFRFRELHGWDVRIAGVYRGNLSNDGERLVLVNDAGVPVFDFTWSAAWHPATAGGGPSLVIPAPWAGVNLSDPGSWAAGTKVHGNPNADDGMRFPGGDPDADPDGDGITRFGHYALAGDGDIRLPELVRTPGGLRLFLWRNALAGDVVATIEWSRSTADWSPLTDAALVESTATDGIRREVWAIPGTTPSGFLRVRFSSR